MMKTLLIISTIIFCLQTPASAQSGFPTNRQFEKIIVHLVPFEGKCPYYHFQVDSQKNVLLHIENTCKEGKSKIRPGGYFMATLTDLWYDGLLKAIEASDLNTVKMRESYFDNHPDITIIAYEGGKRIYINGQVFPAQMDPLLSMIAKIYYELEYQNTDKRFQFEK